MARKTDERLKRAGFGYADRLAAVERLHAADFGEGHVVARLQPVPGLVERGHHPGVVLQACGPFSAYCSYRQEAYPMPHN